MGRFERAFYELLLWHFCGQSQHKLLLATPWINGGYTYATDGKMALRVQDDLWKPTVLVIGDTNHVREWPERRPAGLMDGSMFRYDPDTSGWLPVPVVNRQLAIDDDHESYEDPKHDVKLGENWYDANRVYWFSLIPGCRVLPREYPLPALFSFEHGEGLLTALDPKMRGEEKAKPLK